MRNFPTLEQLKDMSINQIKALDIQSKEEEDAVQKILTIKMKDAPVPHQVYRGDVPDIRTKEDELKWQKIITARENSLRPQDHVQETEVDMNRIPVNLTDREPAVTTEEIPDDTDTDEFGDLADEEEVVTEPQKTEAELEAEIAALEAGKEELLAS